MPDVAGIVLAGGRSSRMGRPKAALEWHGSTLLRRIVGIVARAVDGPVVVVRAPGQALPPLPDAVEVVADAREGRGPLQGRGAGLNTVRDRAPAATPPCTAGRPRPSPPPPTRSSSPPSSRALSPRSTTTSTWCCPTSAA